MIMLAAADPDSTVRDDSDEGCGYERTQAGVPLMLHPSRPLTHFFTPSSSQSQPHLSRLLVPNGATMLPYSAYSDSRLTPLARAYTHQRVTGVGVDSAGRRFDSQYPASGESEIADVLPAYDDKDGPPRYQEALGEVHISGPSPPMVSDTPIAHAEPRDMISSHSNANANNQRCVAPFSQSMISSDVYPADKI
ncbi:hypothetical protein PHLCEN_2v11125 [Hermanssonia centrifuga]|uniref:Uncharacterized protein n=1 Tax=Hermanssonia centrifuga TaxID=98765 RepID=A0A2R6NL39_9APHY|nr:hypothetical protein PHLCEN_2v11125 [Hermanssonia centrifuga]